MIKRPCPYAKECLPFDPCRIKLSDVKKVFCPWINEEKEEGKENVKHKY